VAYFDPEPNSTGNSAQQVMMFPQGFRLPLIVLQALGLGSLIGIVFMANSVGSEYSGDTWKALLPRRGSRIEFILSKLATCVLFMLGLIVMSLLVGQALGFVGSAILGGDLISAESFSLTDLLRSVALVLMEISVFAAITLLVTIVSRSTVVGIVLGVVGTMTFGVAARVTPYAARILPNLHLNNLQAHWMQPEGATKTEMLAQLTSSFGMEMPVVVSTLIVLGYIVGCIAIALAVFHRRDMAGQ
jgi:ABC-type transport system involved in multi-copper enzyme maturation permease subunit